MRMFANNLSKATKQWNEETDESSKVARGDDFLVRSIYAHHGLEAILMRKKASVKKPQSRYHRLISTKKRLMTSNHRMNHWLKSIVLSKRQQRRSDWLHRFRYRICFIRHNDIDFIQINLFDVYSLSLFHFLCSPTMIPFTSFRWAHSRAARNHPNMKQ